MLTQEQIQNLKPGDPLIINGTFVDLDDEGDIEIKISYRLNSREIKGSVYGSPSCVSLPSEIVNSQSSIVNKYAPTRLFKKGDKVRVVEWNGRKPEAEDKLYTVQQDERPGSTMVEVSLNDAGDSFFYTVCFLELVTPVEELRPYSVKHGYKSWHVERKGEIYSLYPYNETVSFSVWRNEEEAKAAAEAERDRLNAEWRKEHANG